MEVSYSKTQQKPKCRVAVHILNDKIHFKYQENVICKFFVARNCTINTTLMKNKEFIF